MPPRRLATGWALVAVVLAASAQASAGGALACEESGMCSVGHVKPWHGDVHKTAALTEALEARSHKKEVIVAVFTPAALPQLLTWIDQVEALGLGHILALALDAQPCQLLLQVRPDMGCAFFGSPMGPHLHELSLLWHWRYRLLARAARLGFNVLSSDLDVIWFDDPYRYLKAAPFSTYQLLGACGDGGGDVHTCMSVGGSFLYLQATGPGGPAVFAIADVADRQLRWLDDGMAWLVKEHGHVPDAQCCMHQDSDVLSEVLPSALAGRPLFRASLAACTEAKARETEAFKQRLAAVAETEKALWSGPKVRAVLRMPVLEGSAIARAAGNTSLEVVTLKLRLPVAGGKWPDEFGGRFLPPQRGSLSQAFLDELRSDCAPPKCPPWHDPEAAAAGVGAGGDEVEFFAFMPPWLFANWVTRGRLGYWLTKPPRQVLGHAHTSQGADPAVLKHLVALNLGLFNFTVYDVLRSRTSLPQHPKHALHFLPYSNHHDMDEIGPARPSGAAARPVPTPKPSAGPAAGAGPRQHVLAIHPYLDLASLVGSVSEFRWLLLGLLQLATLSKRTAVWPDLPCNLPWILPPPAATNAKAGGSGGGGYPIPLPFPADPASSPFMAYGADPTADAAGLRCSFLPLASLPCFTAANAIPEREFVHWRQRHGLPDQPTPEQELLPEQDAGQWLHHHWGRRLRAASSQQPSRSHHHRHRSHHRRHLTITSFFRKSSSASNATSTSTAAGPTSSGLLIKAMLKLDIRDAQAALAAASTQPVLYMSHPLLLWYSQDKADQLQRKRVAAAARDCPAVMMSRDGAALVRLPGVDRGVLDEAPAPQPRLAKVVRGKLIPIPLG